MKEKESGGITAAALHILAMAFMLCDHAWAALFPAAEWLTCIGRLAYPIFAFLLVEGYFHTRNLRRYMGRLLFGAVLSEIPFNLFYAGSVIYPFHQNVLWTFLLSLGIIALIEKVRERYRSVPAAALTVLLVLLGTITGYAAMTDYYGAGVLTVLIFYFFRGRGWKQMLLQFAGLYLINVKLLGGYYYNVSVFGQELEIYQQSLALLAWAPIWLYRGGQGHHSKAFQTFCYLFYPLHMLLLFFIRNLILSA